MQDGDAIFLNKHAWVLTCGMRYQIYAFDLAITVKSDDYFIAYYYINNY